jgi:hypothetical protein
VPYNLTDGQKDLVRWMVQEVRAGKLPEEFWVHWVSDMPAGMLTDGLFERRGMRENILPSHRELWTV